MIKLTINEINFLLKNLRLEPRLKELLTDGLNGCCRINDEDADRLRDLCNYEIDISGYDEDYRLNEKGKFLELISDKLFIG